MPDNELLKAYIERFYGYGTLDAPCWFIGIEEGGGTEINEMDSRLTAWKKLECKPVVDLVGYHREANLAQKFIADPIKLQRTWNGIIRIVLGICDPDVHKRNPEEVTEKCVKVYQRDALGRKEGKTCLLELFPLPSPNNKSWPYNDNYQISYLKNRKSYEEHIRLMREEGIRNLINENKPKVVVFYGVKCQPSWKEIAAGIEFKSASVEVDTCTKYAQNDTTLFISTWHPNARCKSGNDRFYKIGKFIAHRLGQSINASDCSQVQSCLGENQTR